MKQRIHNITIYTDASLCQKTKVGAWACWIKISQEQVIKGAAPFKTDVNCSTEAELKAIYNSLSVVIKRLKPSKIRFVVVTDSEMAKDLITRNLHHDISYQKKKRNKKNPHYKNLIKLGRLINDLVPADCLLKVNKVKAHCNKDGVRSYVNSFVDKACRNAMYAKREQLYGKNFNRSTYVTEKTKH